MSLAVWIAVGVAWGVLIVLAVAMHIGNRDSEAQRRHDINNHGN